MPDIDKKRTEPAESFFEYYGRFWTQCITDILKWAGDQLVGLILAVLILLYHIGTGKIRSHDEGIAGFFEIAWPYLSLLSLYAALHILRAPWLVDRKARAEIADLARALDEKETAPDVTLEGT